MDHGICCICLHFLHKLTIFSRTISLSSPARIFRYISLIQSGYFCSNSYVVDIRYEIHIMNAMMCGKINDQHITEVSILFVMRNLQFDRVSGFGSRSKTLGYNFARAFCVIQIRQPCTKCSTCSM